MVTHTLSLRSSLVIISAPVVQAKTDRRNQWQKVIGCGCGSVCVCVCALGNGHIEWQLCRALVIECISAHNLMQCVDGTKNGDENREKLMLLLLTLSFFLLLNATKSNRVHMDN